MDGTRTTYRAQIKRTHCSNRWVTQYSSPFRNAAVQWCQEKGHQFHAVRVIERITKTESREQPIYDERLVDVNQRIQLKNFTHPNFMAEHEDMIKDSVDWFEKMIKVMPYCHAYGMGSNKFAEVYGRQCGKEAAMHMYDQYRAAFPMMAIWSAPNHQDRVRRKPKYHIQRRWTSGAAACWKTYHSCNDLDAAVSLMAELSDGNPSSTYRIIDRAGHHQSMVGPCGRVAGKPKKTQTRYYVQYFTGSSWVDRYAHSYLSYAAAMRDMNKQTEQVKDHYNYRIVRRDTTEEAVVDD